MTTQVIDPAQGLQVRSGCLGLQDTDGCQARIEFQMQWGAARFGGFVPGRGIAVTNQDDGLHRRIAEDEEAGGTGAPPA